MKRILIATDGSDAAQEAVELGVELAKDEGHDGRCVLEPVELELRSSPALASHLLELKAALEREATTAEEDRARALFHRRLNAEQAAGG